MNSRFITLTYYESGNPIAYRVRADQIVSFSWEPWNCATAVMLKNRTVIYVVDMPAQIEKMIAKAKKGR